MAWLLHNEAPADPPTHTHLPPHILEGRQAQPLPIVWNQMLDEQEDLQEFSKHEFTKYCEVILSPQSLQYS